jgi:hypothetical protein
MMALVLQHWTDFETLNGGYNATLIISSQDMDWNYRSLPNAGRWPATPDLCLQKRLYDTIRRGNVAMGRRQSVSLSLWCAFLQLLALRFDFAPFDIIQHAVLLHRRFRRWHWIGWYISLSYLVICMDAKPLEQLPAAKQRCITNTDP